MAVEREMDESRGHKRKEEKRVISHSLSLSDTLSRVWVGATTAVQHHQRAGPSFIWTTPANGLFSFSLFFFFLPTCGRAFGGHGALLRHPLSFFLSRSFSCVRCGADRTRGANRDPRKSSLVALFLPSRGRLFVCPRWLAAVDRASAALPPRPRQGPPPRDSTKEKRGKATNIPAGGACLFFVASIDGAAPPHTQTKRQRKKKRQSEPNESRRC